MTGKQVRKLVERASKGATGLQKAEFEPGMNQPRLYGADRDFSDNAYEYGVYIVYARNPKRGVNLGPSRIQYIGRGHIGARLRTHLREKEALRRLARRMELKYVWMDCADADGEFVTESILLNEHIREFGALPRFNKQRGSSTMRGWRKVLIWRPGPVALLRRYGG